MAKLEEQKSVELEVKVVSVPESMELQTKGYKVVEIFRENNIKYHKLVKGSELSKYYNK